jgi:spore coat polysaccharide biosynthesis protein SpsF
MINATVEVRMTSSRLRGKPLMMAQDHSLLELLVMRLSKSKHINNIIIATTTNTEDDPIIALCEQKGWLYYRGSEQNVLERVCGAAEQFNTDTLVQITGDCPLIDYRLVDQAISLFMKTYPQCRLVSNTGPTISMPWGFDVQVYKAKELKKILMDNPTNDDKEHVSQRFYLPEYNDQYNPLLIHYPQPLNRSELRVTLDYPEDFTLIKAIVDSYKYPQVLEIDMYEIISWLDAHPAIRDASIRRHAERS